MLIREMSNQRLIERIVGTTDFDRLIALDAFAKRHGLAWFDFYDEYEIRYPQEARDFYCQLLTFQMHRIHPEWAAEIQERLPWYNERRRDTIAWLESLIDD